MTEEEMLEAESFWCENCCHFDKDHIWQDGRAPCKITNTLAYCEESGKDCPFFNVPAADVVAIMHGEWIHEPPYTALNGKYLKASECSNCHAVFVSNGNEPYSDHPYCCECGAKMDGERKEQG